MTGPPAFVGGGEFSAPCRTEQVRTKGTRSVPTPQPPVRPTLRPAVVPENPTSHSPPGSRRPDSEVAQSVALLMARHWQPVHEYAVICLASPASVASMVTAAAFHQVLDRLKLGEPALALRPRLLVTVRDTVRQWSADERAVRRSAGAA